MTMVKTGQRGNQRTPSIPLVAGVALMGAIALCVGACAQATPAWGPGTPRNGAGQPVDAIYGTPLPGYPNPIAL
jgi:hypothetical protein